MVLGRIALGILLLMIIEMFLLIKIGSSLGALSTIALVFITAAVGLWMMRLQGASTLRRAQLAASQGEAPVREAATGAVLLVGGLLLLIPGFFTDFIGLLCLFPPTRALFLRRFKNVKNAANINVRVAGLSELRRDRSQTHTRSPNVIEGEWRKED